MIYDVHHAGEFSFFIRKIKTKSCGYRYTKLKPV